MIDERRIDVLGSVKRKFSVYSMILACFFFVIKLIFNKAYIFIEGLPEIILIISMLITYIKSPKEAVIDERVTNNLNDYYNKAFKIITPMVLGSYILSLIFIFKVNASLVFSPNLFINAFLFIMFIGMVFIVRKHHVYLNESFIEEKKYYINVLKNISYMFTVCAALFAITTLLNLLIQGSGDTNTLFLMMYLASFINIATTYFIYSIYEYNHYHESIQLSEGNIFIVTKNMYLYLSIVFGLKIVHNLVRVFILASENFNVNLVTILSYLSWTVFVYDLVFLIIMTYSLKSTLSRLKNYASRQMNTIIKMTWIYVILYGLNYVIFEFLVVIYNDSTLNTMLLMNINIWIHLFLSFIYLIILILRFKYAKRQNFLRYKLLIIPMMSVFLTILAMIGRSPLQRLFSNTSTAILIEVLISLFVTLIIFINYLFLISVYTKTYETNAIEVYDA